MDMDGSERRQGWTWFAAITIGVASGWNLMLGIAAFVKQDYFDVGSLLYDNLRFWGVVWLTMGALQALTALLVAFRLTLGRLLGVLGASVSMLVWFFSLGAHPIASIVIVALDLLILYALTAEQPDAESLPAAVRSAYPDARSVGSERHYG